MVLAVLGLVLSEGCCPLLEGMSDLWSYLRASVPESGTKPSTMAEAFRTKARSVINRSQSGCTNSKTQPNMGLCTKN